MYSFLSIHSNQRKWGGGEYRLLDSKWKILRAVACSVPRITERNNLLNVWKFDKWIYIIASGYRRCHSSSVRVGVEGGRERKIDWQMTYFFLFHGKKIIIEGQKKVKPPSYSWRRWNTPSLTEEKIIAIEDREKLWRISSFFRQP